jgi:hypothetical protein
MNYIASVIALILETISLISLIVSFIAIIRKIIEGVRCQLRSEMLRCYYQNRETRTIRQYELENFVKLYNAYKALKGNSFIDKIYSEVMEFEVIT